MPAQRTEQIADHIVRQLVAGDHRRHVMKAEILAALTRAREAGAEAMRERAATAVASFPTIRQTVLEIEYAVNAKHGGDATVEDFVPVICGRLAAAIRALPLTEVIPDEH